MKQTMSSEKPNECEGILAYITRAPAAGQDENAENRNAGEQDAAGYAKCIDFQRKNAHFF